MSALKTDDPRSSGDEVGRVGGRHKFPADGGEFFFSDPTGHRTTLSNENWQAVLVRLADQFVDWGDADPDERRADVAAQHLSGIAKHKDARVLPS